MKYIKKFESKGMYLNSYPSYKYTYKDKEYSVWTAGVNDWYIECEYINYRIPERDYSAPHRTKKNAIEWAKRYIDAVIEKDNLIKEADEPSMDDLQRFHKKLMGNIRTHADIEKKYNFIDSNLKEIKGLIDTYIFTHKFRAGVLSKYKIEVPKHTFLQKHSGYSQYHKVLRWDITDSIFKGRQKFIFEIQIEIPRGEEFIEDNTVVGVSIYIKPNNRRKEYFELYNNKITTDTESNLFKLADMIKKLGEQLDKDFEIPIKLSKVKKYRGLDF